MATYFQTPASIVLNGPSLSGKTSYVCKLLKYKDEMFEKKPAKILWCYNNFQKLYTELEKQGITFNHGLPDENLIKDYYDHDNAIIILDDLMSESCNSNNVQQLFFRNAHHHNLTVILIVQNLFEKKLRPITLNAHYIILFKSPRDIGQIACLGRQIGKKKLIVSSYEDATREKFNPLVLDLHPNTHFPDCAIRSHITPDVDTIVYKE